MTCDMCRNSVMIMCCHFPDLVALLIGLKNSLVAWWIRSSILFGQCDTSLLSLEFLCWLLRHHFVGKAAVGSQTVQWWIHGGRGEGWAPPIILRPNWGQKYFLETSPPHPPPIIWRSGSTTAVSCFVMLEFSEFLHCRCNASISYCILLIKQLGRIWVLINFSHLQNRCLFEVGAYLKLGA